MKKILMSLALALCAIIALPAAVNAQNANNCPKKECTKTECKKGDKKACDKNGACNKGECAKTNCKNAECAKADCKDCKNSQACCGKDRKMLKGKKVVTNEGMNPRMKGKKGAMRPGGREAQNPLLKGINLTPEQQQKMKALQEKKMADRKVMRAERKAQNKDEFKKKMDEYEKDVEKILDGDQLKQYKTNKAEMDAKRKAMEKERK